MVHLPGPAPHEEADEGKAPDTPALHNDAASHAAHKDGVAAHGHKAVVLVGQGHVELRGGDLQVHGQPALELVDNAAGLVVVDVEVALDPPHQCVGAGVAPEEWVVVVGHGLSTKTTQFFMDWMY